MRGKKDFQVGAHAFMHGRRFSVVCVCEVLICGFSRGLLLLLSAQIKIAKTPRLKPQMKSNV